MSRFRVSNSGLLVSFILFAVLLGCMPFASAQDTWTGTTSASMKNSNNWSPTTTPSDGDDLAFPTAPGAGAGSLLPNVNFTSTLSPNTLTFGNSAYAMVGD